MFGFRQRLDNTLFSIEATAVLHNLHTMMRIEDGEDEDGEEDIDAGDAETRRQPPNEAENSDSDDEPEPPRQSKEAIRVEGQAIRDSLLSAYFDGNF